MPLRFSCGCPLRLSSRKENRAFLEAYRVALDMFLRSLNANGQNIVNDFYKFRSKINRCWGVCLKWCGRLHTMLERWPRTVTVIAPLTALCYRYPAFINMFNLAVPRRAVNMIVRNRSGDATIIVNAELRKSSNDFRSGKVISPGKRNGKGFIGLFKSVASLVKLIQDVALKSGLFSINTAYAKGTHLPFLISSTSRSIFGSLFSSNSNLPVAPSKFLIFASASLNFFLSVVEPDSSAALCMM